MNSLKRSCSLFIFLALAGCGAPSFDVALWLVERLYGPAVARGVARGLVIDWDPSTIEHRVAH